MPRFSLSPVPSGESHIDYEGDDYREEEEEEDYEEPPHPVGFGSPWGRTWFSLEPPVLDLPGQCRYGLDDDDYDDDDDGFHHIQSYPPLSTYIDARTAPTRVLLRYDKPRPEEEEDDMDRLVQLLSAARIVERLPPPTSFQSPPPWSQTKRAILQKVQSHRERIQQEHMEAAQSLKMLLQETDRQTAKILKQQELEEQAYRQQEEKRQQVQEQEKKAEDAALAVDEEKRQQVQAKKEQLLQESQDAKKAQQEKEAQKTEYVVKGKKLVAQLVQIRASIEPFDNSKAVSKRRLQMKKIVRGKVNTLSEDAHKVQAVATEVSQAIGAARTEDEQLKQRMQQGDTSISPEMARGKRYLVDLLASNAIQRVQAEGFNGTRGDGFPLAAMLTLVSIDNKELVPIMAAHIYTVCPTAIPTLPTLKADASEDEVMSSLGMLKDKTGEFETFPRFLSRTESIISLVANIMASTPDKHGLLGGNKGAVEWLSRFLSLLPPAPTAPLPLITAPVLIAFLTGAGHMLATKHAEHFQKYLDIITNDILKRVDEGDVGKPSSIRLRKTLEVGFKGFQKTLPSRALPELYHATGGSSLSSSHGGGSGSGASSFGQPASSGGGSSFAQAMTSGQSSGSGTASTSPFGGGGGGGGIAAPSPFGGGQQQQQGMATPSPFGGGQQQQQQGGSGGGQQEQGRSGGGQQQQQGRSNSNSNSGKRPCSFWAQGTCRNGDNCKFAHEGPSGGGNGGGGGAGFNQNNNNNNNNNNNSGAFGGSSGNMGNSTTSVANDPFGSGGNSMSNASPFGGNNNNMGGAQPASHNSPFGGNQSSTAASSFGAGPSKTNSAAPSPFGGPSSGSQGMSGAAAPSPSPFGAPSGSGFGGGAPAPSPFGGAAPAAASPFGAAAPAVSGSGFGGGAPAPSPFGGAAAPAASPFGGAAPAAASPFGAAAPAAASPFGAAAPAAASPFGGASSGGYGGNTTNASPFGGGGGNQNASFGQNTGASPFGNPAPSPSPFGGSQNNQYGGGGGGGRGNQQGGFGGNNQNSSSGRGGNSSGNKRSGGGKKPCSFWAAGSCRYGDNCRFSHEGPAGGGGGGGGRGGGGRGNQSFGGGGGFGGNNNSPFGGPRR